MELEKLLDVRIILAVFFLVTVFGASQGALEWDEGSFLMNAEYFSGTDINFENSRPAFISLAVAGLWKLTGESTFAARFLVVLTGVLAIYVFYRLAEMEFDEPLALTAAFAFSPLMLYWSWHVYTDVPALALLLGSLYAFRNQKHFLAGVLVALSAVTRYIFLVFGIGMGIGYIIKKREKLLDFLSGSAIGSLPLLAFSYYWFGNAVAKIYLYTTRASSWSGSGVFAETVAGLKSGLYMLSVLIPASVKGWRESPLVEKTMLVSYSVFIIFVVGNSFHRYWLPAIPLLLLMAYRGLDRNIFAVVAITAILISGHGVYSNMTLQEECGKPLEEAIDYTSDLEGIVVSEQSSITGYLLDRKVNSRWKSLERLKDEEGAKYAILTSDEPYRELERFSNRCITYRVYDLDQKLS